MAKKKKTRDGAGSSPFVLVRSTTGRQFQRAGIRFHPDRDEPVNLDKLEPAQRTALLESKHIAIAYVEESEYQSALSEQEEREQVELDGSTPEEMRLQINALTNERDALRAEIALLTGRSNRDGGPRENDDKRTKPGLIG